MTFLKDEHKTLSSILDTDHLINEIEELGQLLAEPSILHLQNEDLIKQARRSAWINKGNGEHTLKAHRLGEECEGGSRLPPSHDVLADLVAVEVAYRASVCRDVAAGHLSTLKGRALSSSIIGSTGGDAATTSAASARIRSRKQKLKQAAGGGKQGVKKKKKGRKKKIHKQKVSEVNPNNMDVVNEIIRAQREHYYKKKSLSLSKKLGNAKMKQQKFWKIIVKKELCKYVRQRINQRKELTSLAKRAARDCARHQRQRALISQKYAKDAVSRGKRLSREIATYWRQFERVEKVARKRADRDKAEQRRADFERLEAQRQRRKLNFLITQTELYAHFMARKMGAGQEEDVAVESGAEEEEEETWHILQRLEDDGGETAGSSSAVLVDDYDVEIEKTKVLKVAQEAVEKQKFKTAEFDSPYERGSSSALAQASLSGDFSERVQPSLFQGQLKHYQLKGMNWLLNLFEQGINGILADEMGLGKTIQTMAFLGVLAESYNLWGPFLVVAPTSTLHNWTQEFARFLPAVKVVPYWGTPSERKVLRRYWSTGLANQSRPAADATSSSSQETTSAGGGNHQSQQLGSAGSSFHVLVTSYQVMRQDSKFLSKLNWQYMVLDEAQAIKSTTSQRWNTLLGFNCRNRLLLTGTPIQNTMQELWALLHFIMPTLFDSHEEFNEWFSKDIESQVAASLPSNTGGEGGLASRLTDQQLSRLHMILKPFMLRRVKADVENELSDKIEVLIYCEVSSRQRSLYDQLKRKISLDDLKDVALRAGQGHEVGGGSWRTRSLLNIVMQLRKVCNHPDLIQRRGVRHACTLGLVEQELPSLLYNQDLLGNISNPLYRSTYLNKFHVFSADNVHNSLFHRLPGDRTPSCFSYSRYIDLSCSQVELYSTLGPGLSLFLHRSCQSHLTSLHQLWHQSNTMGTISLLASSLLPYAENHPLLTVSQSHNLRPPQWTASLLLHVLARPPVFHMAHSSWPRALATRLQAPSNRWCVSVQPRPSIELVSQSTRISDSCKLRVLDTMLTRLKAEGHRVLIYSQMTRMIDILEELMTLRHHEYIRLDGSSKLSDRRDMVANFQTREEIFVFLLSTRAGGLGINLTAADTVIFFDSDWNPTVDQQAMDRAHRLGQTKQVTVYRLICRHSVEEKILRRAEEKREMQRMVIRGGEQQPPSSAATLRPREMVSLLLDDEEMESRLQQGQSAGGRDKRQREELGADEGEGDGEVKETGSLLDRKRRAAWAARSRGGGRPKKFRPLSSVGQLSVPLSSRPTSSASITGQLGQQSSSPGNTRGRGRPRGARGAPLSTPPSSRGKLSQSQSRSHL